MGRQDSVLKAIHERLRHENRELEAENRALQAQLAELLQLREQWDQVLETVRQLRAENAALQASLTKAQQRIEELERTKARQAAPFRRRKRKGDGKPGRKPGFRGTQRQLPAQIDHDINVPLDPNCPRCSCPLDRPLPLTQYIEEIPPLRPEVTRLTTWQATCPCCGKEVRSTHPLQVSQAQGAAGIHLGPRATALATVLKTHFGLPMRKVSGILKQGFGLSLSAGGLSHLLHRVAQKARPQREELLEQIRSSPAVYADETSWYVGQPGDWLWVCTTPQYTLYHVDSSRGRPVIEKLLGVEFAGTLVTDCAAIYKCLPWRQHKCIAHHLRWLEACRLLEDMQDLSYLDAWKTFWQDVIGLAHARDDLPAAAFDEQHATLRTRMTALIEQQVHQTGDRKFQTRMRNAQKHLLGCLEHRVEPTNNRAERAIRPAVIARKVSCGNKTQRGAATWEILASQCATLYQQGLDLLTHFTQIVLSPPALAG